MSESVLEQYAKLQDAMRKCLILSLEKHPKIFGNLHQMDEDLMRWSNVMPECLVGQFLTARREFTMATYCAASGMYQQAYSGIRFFLELSFASVYYSLYEFERRQWMMDRIDYSWSKGMDRNDGILSSKFVEVFQPNLASHAKEFFEKATVTYRHCSQFIHGKASMYKTLPKAVMYSEEVLQDWAKYAQYAGDASLFLLLVRYADLLDGNDQLVDVVEAGFGRLLGVRKMIGLADG